MEAPPGIGPGMKVLQTSALPLGYGATYPFIISETGAFVKMFSDISQKCFEGAIAFSLFRVGTCRRAQFFAVLKPGLPSVKGGIHLKRLFERNGIHVPTLSFGINKYHRLHGRLS